MITSNARLAAEIESARLDKDFANLYGSLMVDAQKKRYLRLLNLLAQERPGAEVMFVNAPGRTELGGNHTDHNHGCVLAASVDLDCVAAVTPTEAQVVTLFSEEYATPIRVDVENLGPHPGEQGQPEALVRGIAAAFYERTGLRHGFSGYLSATCRPGTGLSTSAAFSVLVGSAFNFLFYNSMLSAEDLAVMARQAENDFFGKPCGLMDQMASSVGSTIFIDFFDPEKPVVKPIDSTLEGTGYRLVIIDTGGSHVGLTEEYAAIPEEMCAAAEAVGHSCGRGISRDTFLDSLAAIRNVAGDRAALRLLHFIEENERAAAMAGYLQEGEFPKYLQCVEASGNSSCCLLQNCATATSSREQGILLALAVSQRICSRAVCRVHGGGFAGTVQAYVPEEEFDDFCSSMGRLFGAGSVIAVRVGRPGACGLICDGLVFPHAGDNSI